MILEFNFDGSIYFAYIRNGTINAASHRNLGPLKNQYREDPQRYQYLFEHAATYWCRQKTEYIRKANMIKEKFYRHRGDRMTALIDSLFVEPEPSRLNDFYSGLKELRKLLKECQSDGPYLYGDVHEHLSNMAYFRLHDLCYINYGKCTAFEAWQSIKQVCDSIGAPFVDPYGLEFCKDNVTKLSALHETSVASLTVDMA